MENRVCEGCTLPSILLLFAMVDNFQVAFGRGGLEVNHNVFLKLYRVMSWLVIVLLLFSLWIVEEKYRLLRKSWKGLKLISVDTQCPIEVAVANI